MEPWGEEALTQARLEDKPILLSGGYSCCHWCDYAFLLDALLELLQAEFRPEDLAFAQDVAERLLAQFEDGTCGGFYFTSHDHEQLIH